MRRDLSWKELCEKAWGKQLHKPDIAYEFSNGRIFYDHRPDFSEIDFSSGSDTGSLYADNYADDYA